MFAAICLISDRRTNSKGCVGLAECVSTRSRADLNELKSVLSQGTRCDISYKLAAQKKAEYLSPKCRIYRRTHSEDYVAVLMERYEVAN